MSRRPRLAVGACAGKNSNACLLNRNNLGKIAQAWSLPTVVRGRSVATYYTGVGTYFAFHTENNAFAPYKVTATNAATVTPTWNISLTGLCSAFVTSTGGINNVILWAPGVGGDQRLRAYNGDNGTGIYSGGVPNEMMTGTREWNTRIVAPGRIYYPGGNTIYVLVTPGEVTTLTPTPTATPPVTATPIPTATPTSTPPIAPIPINTRLCSRQRLPAVASFRQVNMSNNR